MALLDEMDALVESMGIACYTGAFPDEPPNEYIVLQPLEDEFKLYADDKPQIDVQAVRANVFTPGDFRGITLPLTLSIMSVGAAVITREYVEFDNGTGRHHYIVEAEKPYPAAGHFKL